MKFFEYSSTKGCIPYWDIFIHLFWGHIQIFMAYDVIFDVKYVWWTDDPIYEKGNKRIQNLRRILHICETCSRKRKKKIPTNISKYLWADDELKRLQELAQDEE